MTSKVAQVFKIATCTPDFFYKVLRKMKLRVAFQNLRVF